MTDKEKRVEFDKNGMPTRETIEWLRALGATKIPSMVGGGLEFKNPAREPEENRRTPEAVYTFTFGPFEEVGTADVELARTAAQCLSLLVQEGPLPKDPAYSILEHVVPSDTGQDSAVAIVVSIPVYENSKPMAFRAQIGGITVTGRASEYEEDD